jgi:ribosomal protein S14
MKKIVLKSLLADCSFKKTDHIYFGKKFSQFTKFFSISFYRHYCVFTANTRSVSRKFKIVRHQCRKLASKGFLVGLRKASF